MEKFVAGLKQEVRWTIPLVSAFLVALLSYRPVVDVANLASNVVWDSIFRYKDQLDLKIYLMIKFGLWIGITGTFYALVCLILHAITQRRVHRVKPQQLEFNWTQQPSRRSATSHPSPKIVRRLRLEIRG